MAEVGGQPKIKFPSKLWDAVNSPKDLIFWDEDGSSVMVDAVKFEDQVMNMYPNLVRISTFPNFRRQMRLYGFSWDVDDSGYYVFTHPLFQMNRIDLLPKVVSKRREKHLGSHISRSDSQLSDDDDYICNNSQQTVTRKSARLSSLTNITMSESFQLDDIEDPEPTDDNYHYVNGIKRRKYRKRRNCTIATSDVGVQTSMTMCKVQTRFVGSLQVNGNIEDFYQFDDINKILSEHMEKGIVNLELQDIEDVFRSQESYNTDPSSQSDINQVLVELGDTESSDAVIPMHYFEHQDELYTDLNHLTVTHVPDLLVDEVKNSKHSCSEKSYISL